MLDMKNLKALSGLGDWVSIWASTSKLASLGFNTTAVTHNVYMKVY